MSRKILITIIVTLAASLLLGLNAWAKGTAGEEFEAVEETPRVITKYNEAPMLAELVAKGELPSVDKRLPDEPMVMECIGEIGEYGGQLRTYNNDLVPHDMWGSPLLRVPRNAVGNAPNLAAGYEVSDDKKAITVYLRPGTKWSDGQPFTSEDIRFMYDDMHNREPRGEVYTWHATGRIQETEVIDDYTIKLICPEGIGISPMQLASWEGTQTNSYTAAHYLKQWHIDYNTDAEKISKEEGFDNWYECFNSHSIWFGSNMDLNLPKVTPWIPVQQSINTELHERNPYYWAVDEAGNQLPYIDSAIVQIVDPEVYQLKVTGGEADIAWNGLSFENMELYISSAESGNYRVELHPGADGSDVELEPANWYFDPAERDIWRNLKFRQALSVAVDRDDINESVYSGYGVARQCAPLPSVSYYKEEWGEYYAQYDPDLANQLLDEVGLAKRNSAGYRLRPDGKLLSVIIQYYEPTFTSVIELVREYWEAVGLKTVIKMGETELLEQRFINLELQLHQKYPGQPTTSERDAYSKIHWWGGINGMSKFSDWLEAKGEYLAAQSEADVLPPNWRFMEVPEEVEKEFPGVKPDDEIIQARTDMDSFVESEMGSPEYMRLAQEIFDFYVFNLHYIGFVGMVPNAMIVNNRIGNAIPKGWVNGFGIKDNNFVSQWMDQLYIKE